MPEDQKNLPDHDPHMTKEDYNETARRVNRGNAEELDFDVDNLDETQRDKAIAFFQNQPSELNKQEIEVRNALQDVAQDKERAEHIVDREVRVHEQEEREREADRARQQMLRDREEAERNPTQPDSSANFKTQEELDDERVAHQTQSHEANKQAMVDNSHKDDAPSETEAKNQDKSKTNTEVDPGNKDKGHRSQDKNTTESKDKDKK